MNILMNFCMITAHLLSLSMRHFSISATCPARKKIFVFPNAYLSSSGMRRVRRVSHAFRGSILGSLPLSNTRYLVRKSLYVQRPGKPAADNLTRVQNPLHGALMKHSLLFTEQRKTLNCIFKRECTELRSLRAGQSSVFSALESYMYIHKYI